LVPAVTPTAQAAFEPDYYRACNFIKRASYKHQGLRTTWLLW